jgi:orotate phosphoribosyltransferase
VESFLDLVGARQGHFRLESGLHGGVWLDLDGLFADDRRIQPFVDRVVAPLRGYEIDGVCGPLLGGAFLAQSVAKSLGVEFWYTERLVATHRDGLYQARYRLPGALETRVAGKRCAIVDDVMSAGSALRGTLVELEAHGGTTVVAGALLVLGSTGADFFASRHIPVVAAARLPYEIWAPGDCPLCAADVPLEETIGA